VKRAGGEDEGTKRHRWRQDGRHSDSQDGVRFHPATDCFEYAGRGAFFNEGHTAGLADAPGEPTSESGAGGGDRDQEDGVLVLGGEQDKHDVGDAGDGERHERGIDDGDEEEADDAEVQQQVHEMTAVLG
jgi:hypothetical protein